MSLDTTECSSCGTLLDTAADTPEARAPCHACGATGRGINVSIVESLTIRDGIGVQAKRPGESRPYVEDKAMPSYSHSLGKNVLHERVIDRDNDRYVEKVTDFETGEVIHYKEEPLSEHRGHGSAKVKKREDDG